MEKTRRDFMAAVAATSISLTIAGCSSTTEERSISDVTFSLIDTPPENTRVVSHDESSNKIVVKGSLTVSDGCKTVSLGRDPHYSSESVVEFTVEQKDTGADVCTQALRTIGYKLEFEYSEGSSPETISVNKKGVESDVVTVDVPYAY